MPELPEVETIRRDLEAEVIGRRIVRATATGARSIRRYPAPEPFAASLEGSTVAAVRRHGKYLIADLDDRDESLIVHLRMSGQLLLVDRRDPQAPPLPKHTHVVLDLDDGRELRFVDPRTFGELFVARPAEALAHIGPDALALTSDHLVTLLSTRRRKLKDLLMDQQVIAGIGNIYSDEILWSARLRFDRLSSSLTTQETRRLLAAIRAVLDDAIAHRGSSLADEQYRDLFGVVGAYATRHQVFAREGEQCGRCKGPVVRIKYGGRSHFFCETCQT